MQKLHFCDFKVLELGLPLKVGDLAWCLEGSDHVPSGCEEVGSWEQLSVPCGVQWYSQHVGMINFASISLVQTISGIESGVLLDHSLLYVIKFHYSRSCCYDYKTSQHILQSSHLYSWCISFYIDLLLL